MNSDPSLTTAPPFPEVTIAKLLADKAALANQVQGLMLQVECLKVEKGNIKTQAVALNHILKYARVYVVLTAGKDNDLVTEIDVVLEAAQAAGITEEK